VGPVRWAAPGLTYGSRWFKLSELSGCTLRTLNMFMMQTCHILRHA